MAKHTNSVMLELVSDKQLNDMKRSDELLFTGKIVIKEEGGFKKLYDLPDHNLLDRCTTKYDSMKGVLTARFKHYGWLCNRDSGWSKHMCVLFANLGLIFIYVKPTKGYVLKLSFGKKLEVRSERKKILAVDTPPESCVVKIMFGFGALELQLTSKETEKWRRPLLNAFDGNLPCFELPKKETAKTKDSPKMVDAAVSTCDITSKSNLSDTESLGVESLSRTQAKLSTCSELSLVTPASLSTCEIDDEYKAIQRFLAPLKEINDETTAFPEMADSLILIAGAAETRENDSGFGSNEEIDKSSEEYRPIPPVRKSINSSKTSSITGTTAIEMSTPVYRLETEREKPSPREPPSRISEKIRYWEQKLNGIVATEAQFTSEH